jgi:hypothetical protein
MKHTSPLFFEYSEVRRRVERKLANTQLVMSHFLVFLFAEMVVLSTRVPGEPSYWRQLPTSIGIPFALWSFVLLGHGLWVYRKSGASAKAREAVIHSQLEERLEHGDTELLNTQREAFRLQGLLDEDIRKRSSVYTTTLVFLALNVVGWVIYVASQRDATFPWNVMPLTLMFLTPALMVNFLSRLQRKRIYTELLEHWQSQPDTSAQKSKQKRREDDAAVRLSDDGELVEDFEVEMGKARRTN